MKSAVLALALGGLLVAAPLRAQEAAAGVARLEQILRTLDGPGASPEPAAVEGAAAETLEVLADLAGSRELVGGVPAPFAGSRLALQIGNVLMHRYRRLEDARAIARNAQSVYLPAPGNAPGAEGEDEGMAAEAMAQALAESREGMTKLEGGRDLNRATDPGAQDRAWLGWLGLVVALGALAALRRRSVQPDGVRVADADVQRRARSALETGLALLREDRLEEAMPYFREVSELQSTLREDGRFSLALVEMRRGHAEKASELVEDLDVGHVDADEVYALADELERRGHTRGARRMFEKLYLADVDFRDVQARLEALRERAAATGEEDVARLIVERVVDERFREVRQLASGGMGFIFTARDQERGDLAVALKVLSPFYANDADAYARFLQEAEVLASLEHPAIIRIYDVFGKSLPYYSMQLHDSPTLAQLLAAEGPLPEARVRGFGLQLLGALEAAHRAGVVHRDVKPANVLVGEGDAITLLDFGVARLGEGAMMTLTGQVLGSPRYMAPEQQRGFDVDHRVDVYAAGLVLYELLAGELPEPEARRGLPGPPPLPAGVEASPDLAAALGRALEPEPERRFPSAAAFAASLEGPAPSA